MHGSLSLLSWPSLATMTGGCRSGRVVKARSRISVGTVRARRRRWLKRNDIGRKRVEAGHLAFSVHFPTSTQQQEHQNSNHLRSKRWRWEVSRQRALQQEGDLRQSAIAGFEANTTIRKVVVQAAEILLGRHVHAVSRTVVRSMQASPQGHVVKIHVGEKPEPSAGKHALENDWR